MNRKYLPLLLSSLLMMLGSANTFAADAESEVWEAAKSANSVAAYKTYLKAYPKGRYAVAAKIRMESAGGQGAAGAAVPTASAVPAVPAASARPSLPITIDASVWQVLENSALYQKAPKSRNLTQAIEVTTQTEYTGAKNSSLAAQGAVKKQTNTALSPISDKCYTSTSTTRMQVPNVNVPESNQVAYMCGLMVLMGATSNGTPQMSIANLQVNGSLFPPQVGATQSVRYTTLWLADAKYNMETDSTCNITGKLSAASLNPKLAGTAWAMQCKTTRISGGKPTTYQIEDYLLEDMGLLASVAGVVDMQAKRVIFPAVGTTTIQDVPGDYGVRITTTYDRFDIQPGN